MLNNSRLRFDKDIARRQRGFLERSVLSLSVLGLYALLTISHLTLG